MISIASDHGGFELKEKIKKHLQDRGFEVKDFGCYDLSSCDYPDFARPAAEAVADGTCEKGVVVCTTGIGVSITANKVKGIRCALCGDLVTAELTRLHNDSNMVAIGAGITGEILAMQIVDKFLDTQFSGQERHARRIEKMMATEK